MSGRYAVATIAALFSIWCVFVSVLTFLGANGAEYHLPSFYLLGYGAIYAILSPFGLAGILGALHRKKSLIRGFLFQYSVAYIILTGMNVVSVILSHKWEQMTLVVCVSETYRPGAQVAGTQRCENRIKEGQLACLLFTCVQGGIMLIFGIILLIFGRREFQNIKIDEETSSLLEKSAFVNDELLPSEPKNVHSSPSYRSNYNNGLSHNPTTNTTTSGISRHPTTNTTTSGISRHPTTNTTTSGLSRHPTTSTTTSGLSRHTTINTASSGLSRHTTNASTFSNRTPLLPSSKIRNNNYNQLSHPQGTYSTHHRLPPPPPPPSSGYYNDNISNNGSGMYAAPSAPLPLKLNRTATTKYYEYNNNQLPPPPQQYNMDNNPKYWQPQVSRTLANDLTRKELNYF